MSDLATYVRSIVDGGALPSERQWATIVEMVAALPVESAPPSPSEAMDGAEVRRLREARRWSQADLAERVGTTQQSIARIERGETLHSRYFGRIRDAFTSQKAWWPAQPDLKATVEASLTPLTRVG